MAQSDFTHRTYLIVDDMAYIRELLRGLLRALGVTQMDQASNIGKTFVDHREAAIYQASAMAIVKQEQGDTSGAAAALQAAEQAIAEFGSGLAPRLSLEMMATCSRLGETQKAIALLQQAVGNNHDDHEFLAEVVQVCHDTGLAEAADTAIRQIQRDKMSVRCRIDDANSPSCQFDGIDGG